MTNQKTSEPAPVAILCGDSADREFTLKMRLTRKGFLVIPVPQADMLPVLCKRHCPQIVILRFTGAARDVITVLRKLIGLGMTFSAVPTFLLVRRPVARIVAPLLEIGLEDILDIESGMEVLASRPRIHRARTSTRENSQSNQTSATSTRGNLADLSIIDLIQALGPSQRTTRLTVTPNDVATEGLVIYLKKGAIVHAVLGDKQGEKAFYQALTWTEGSWLLEPIADDQIPATTVDLPNEHLLMEGCRLMDESRSLSVASE